MNVVIYARYSSDRQTEASIEGQLKVCYDYAERNNHTVIGEYIDRALTGKTDKRPKFQKMIKDSEKGAFQGVLIYQTDRFARNRYDSATYKAKLKKNGVCVISARETITEDASGILMESVLEGMAEYFSAELSQKVKRGMNLNAEKCIYNGGTVPFGFKIVNKKYTIDVETAPYVKKIFEMYADGHTIKEIIDFLNVKNIKTSTGTKFNYNSLHTMLKNKKYIGVYTYGSYEIENGIPRIISNELFYKVQRTTETNKKAPARAKAVEEYLLTTKLFCGHCKDLMVGVSGTSRTKKKFCYYSCNKSRKKLCNKKNVGKEYIEDIVINKCRQLLTDENIELIAQAFIKANENDESTFEIKRLDKEIKRCNKEKSNLLQALKQCDMDDVKQDIFNEIKAINTEIEKMSAEIATIKNNSVATIDENEVKFFLQGLRKGDVDSKRYRKALVTIFVNAIYLYDDKITYVFNIGNAPVTLPFEYLEDAENAEDNGSNLMKNGSPVKNRLTNRVERFLLFFQGSIISIGVTNQ